MTENYDKIESRFAGLIKKYNMGSYFESGDLLSEWFCMTLEGKAQKQTLEQFFIDLMRKRFGDSRQEYGRIKQKAIFTSRESDETLSSLPHDVNTEALALKQYLSKEERSIFVLHYEWGFNETEIANIFGVSSSRICQRLQRVQERIRKKIAAEKQRENSRELEAVLRQETKGNRWRVESFADKAMARLKSWGVESYLATCF